MANDSHLTDEDYFMPNGIYDIAGSADIAINEEVYISADHTVTTMPAGASEAVVRTRLGWATRPYTHGSDNVVPIQTKYKRRLARTAGGNITHGKLVKLEYGAGAINGQVIEWVPGTDDADQIIGIALNDAVDTGTVYTLEE